MSRTPKTSRPTKTPPTPRSDASAGTSFNLRSLVREVAKTTPHENPAQLAEQVAKSVPDEALRSALEQALTPFVRQTLNEDRPQGPIARPESAPTPAATFGYGQPEAPRRAANPAPSENGQAPVRYVGSRKGSEIRDAWQRTLEAPYSVSPGVHKPLGDCAYDELQYIAAELDKQADRHKARARGFRELAALLTDHDAPTLRELPAAVLMQALGGR